MSRLEELIQELCPDGVEYKSVGSVSQVVSPTKKIKSHEYLGSGQYPVIDQGQDFIGGYTNEESAFPEDEYIIFGDHTCVVKFVDFEFLQGADGVKVLKAFNEVIPKYLYYSMSNIKIESGYARHWSKMKKEFIAVPPIEVQREIVRILDNFTELTAELTTELTAELTARKQQYEYYCNALTAFESSSEVDWIPMGDLFDFRNGLNKGKDFFGSGTPFIRYTDVYSHRALRKNDITALVECTTEETERLKVSRGDVLFTRTSETSEDVGWSAVMLDEIGDCVFNGFTIKATPKTNKLLPEYCAFCFSSNRFRKYVTQHCAFTTRASLTGDTISKYKLPVPSIETQGRIAGILNNLNNICTDINAGLPAEIRARQKQYEYYRDKLLTFKEKVA